MLLPYINRKKNIRMKQWKVSDFVPSKCNVVHYSFFVFRFFYWWGGTKSLGTAATSGLLYKPQMIDEDDGGAIGGMKIGRGNRSTRRKPAPAPLCPPPIPHDQTQARTPGHRVGKPATNRFSYGAVRVPLLDSTCLGLTGHLQVYRLS
jgi:hypothetical protein